MDEARANAAQISERGRSAGAPAVTLPASLPDDVVRAICTYLEGHRGAARRLTLVNKAFHALVEPWRLPDVVWRAFGPLAGERHFEGLPPRLPGTSMAPRRSCWREVDDGFYKPSEIPRVASDWRPVSVLESASATPDSEGGFGVGLNAQCPLYYGFEGEGPYANYVLEDDSDPDHFEGESVYMSGIHYRMYFDAPPGPFSEFFELLVHVYFKPFGADGQTKWWIRDGIDDVRDELLPPLRPFAIKISLVPRDAADQGNQEHIKVAEATVRAYLATILK